MTVGTGPFELTEYTPDQDIVYTRNDDYTWGPDGGGKPSFKTLRVDILPEASVRGGRAVERPGRRVVTNLPPKPRRAGSR